MCFNPLNAELNPICHLLVLLGNLTFMGPCIVSIFQYISNKMQRYTVYLYLQTTLHVSGGTSTHHQDSIHLYLQHLVFVTPLLLSAAIVEELELIWVCCGWRVDLFMSHVVADVSMVPMANWNKGFCSPVPCSVNIKISYIYYCISAHKHKHRIT